MTDSARDTSLFGAADRLYNLLGAVLDVVQPAGAIIREYCEGRQPTFDMLMRYVQATLDLRIEYDYRDSEDEPVETILAWIREERNEELHDAIYKKKDGSEEDEPTEVATA